MSDNEAPAGDSIHPRAQLHGQKTNTCGKRNSTNLIRAIGGMERHLATNPHDAACAMRLANARRKLAEGK